MSGVAALSTAHTAGASSTPAGWSRGWPRGGTNLVTVAGISAARWPKSDGVDRRRGRRHYRELRSQTGGTCRRTATPAAWDRDTRWGSCAAMGEPFWRRCFATALVGADVVLLDTDFRTGSLAAALCTHRIGTAICDDEFAARVHDADESVTVIDAANVCARR